MNSEQKAIGWLGIESYNQWRLFNSKDEKVSEFESESEDSAGATERLTEVLTYLEPGRYALKAWKGKSRQAAQSVFNFDIKRMAESVPVQNNRSVGGDMSFDELLRKAKELAVAEMEERKFKEEVRKDIFELKASVDELRKSLLELTDDDDDNDMGAIARIADMGEKLPGIVKGIEGMKGLFGAK